MTAPDLYTVYIAPNGLIYGGGPAPLVGIPGTFSYNGAGQPVTVSEPSVIPLQPESAQILYTVLSNQNVILNLYFKQIWVPTNPDTDPNPPVLGEQNPLFMDLYVGNALIVGGVVVVPNCLIVQNSYLGFIGDMAIIDTQPPVGQGAQPPQVSGLGSRWLLTYWPELN